MQRLTTSTSISRVAPPGAPAGTAAAAASPPPPPPALGPGAAAVKDRAPTKAAEAGSSLDTADLVLLDPLSNKTITQSLQERFAKNKIYTNIGSVLLCVNPFKTIHEYFYSEEMVQFYKNNGAATLLSTRHGTTMNSIIEQIHARAGKNSSSNTSRANQPSILNNSNQTKGAPNPTNTVLLDGPHIFALADETYKTMMLEEEDQCVIISGESGAGKTEASKQILFYISQVSRQAKTSAGGDAKGEQNSSGNNHNSSNNNKNSNDEIDRINAVMIDSNPLLESFGNAKTLRNDNSSRFGKFFKLYFNQKTGKPVGGNITIFLLEKSRVVSHKRGERNFHIFYQLCSSMLKKNEESSDNKNNRKRSGPGVGVDLAAIQQLLSGHPSEEKKPKEGDGLPPPLNKDSKDDDVYFMQLRSQLGLCSPSHFHYLNQGGLYGDSNEEIKANSAALDRKDGSEWRETVDAMRTMNLSHAAQQSIIVTLSAILYLGELQFIESSIGAETSSKKREEGEADTNTNANTGSSTVKNNSCMLKPNKRPLLSLVAVLLQVDEEELLRCLLYKKLTIKERSEVSTLLVPHDLQQCCNTRDALAKNIFHYLFNFMVETVNRALESSSTAASETDGKKKQEKKSGLLMLGVLDIYGFEVFEQNYFEQLCINYVNEKLQQIFIELTLRKEQEEYAKENIAWTPIPFFDNVKVCSLLEKESGGIFAMLDDICLTMAREEEDVVDEKILDRLDLLLENNPLNQNEDARASSAVGGADSKIFKKTDHGFSLQHYAGEVRYTTKGFTSANKDLLSFDLLALLSTSKNAFLTEILDPLLEVFIFQTNNENNNPNNANNTNNKAKKKFTTAGFKIRQQANELVNTLKRCNPHYIRTIKPNDEKKKDLFTFNRVMHQVHYLGLLENIKVKRAGFSYRNYFDKFIKRFKYICTRTYPHLFEGTDREAASLILSALSGSRQTNSIHPSNNAATSEKDGGTTNNSNNNHNNYLAIEYAPELRVPREDWQLGVHKLFIKKPQNVFALEEARNRALDALATKIQRLFRRYQNRKIFYILRNQMNQFLKKQFKRRRAESYFLEYVGHHLEWLEDTPVHTDNISNEKQNHAGHKPQRNNNNNNNNNRNRIQIKDRLFREANNKKLRSELERIMRYDPLLEAWTRIQVPPHTVLTSISSPTGDASSSPPPPPLPAPNGKPRGDGKYSYYYLNRLTGQTQWEEPAELSSRNVQRHRSGGGAGELTAPSGGGTNSAANLYNSIVFAAELKQISVEQDPSRRSSDSISHSIVLIITNEHLFIFERVSQEDFYEYLMDKKRTHLPKNTTNNTNDRPLDDARHVEANLHHPTADGDSLLPYDSLLLKKKVDLRLLSEVGLTPYADSALLLRFFLPSVPYRPVVPSTAAELVKDGGVDGKRTHHVDPTAGATDKEEKDVPTLSAGRYCEVCQTKFSPAARRGICRCCGRLCCQRRCLRYYRPLPTLYPPLSPYSSMPAPVDTTKDGNEAHRAGYDFTGGRNTPLLLRPDYKKYKVCPSCVQSEPYEPVEDVLLLSERYKSEIAAHLSRLYYLRTNGGRLPTIVSDRHLFQVQLRPPGGAVGREDREAGVGSSYRYAELLGNTGSDRGTRTGCTVATEVSAQYLRSLQRPAADDPRMVMATVVVTAAREDEITPTEIETLLRRKEETREAATRRRREEELLLREKEREKEEQRLLEHKKLVQERKQKREMES